METAEILSKEETIKQLNEAIKNKKKKLYYTFEYVDILTIQIEQLTGIKLIIEGYPVTTKQELLTEAKRNLKLLQEDNPEEYSRIQFAKSVIYYLEK